MVYTYDHAGNLTSGGGLTNTWNYKNQLTETDTASSTVTYAYDEAGQRVKIAGSETTYTPSRYYEETGTSSKRHIYLGGDLLATIDVQDGTTTPLYIHRDHLGSTQVITKDDQSLAERIAYYPFGGIRTDDQYGPSAERKKFTGHEYDTDTGLYYMQARYQNPEIGRFVSEDQVFWTCSAKSKKCLQNPQAFNSYSYTLNNPLRFVDPDGAWFREVLTGQQSWSDFGLEIGTAADGLSQESQVWNFAMSHPILSGGVVGVSAGFAAEGAMTAYGAGVAAKYAALKGGGAAYVVGKGIFAASSAYLSAETLLSTPDLLAVLDALDRKRTVASGLNVVGVYAWNLGPSVAGVIGGPVATIGAVTDILQTELGLASSIGGGHSASSQGYTTSYTSKGMLYTTTYNSSGQKIGGSTRVVDKSQRAPHGCLNCK